MELNELFDSFYEKLVLRDFFGKIVPGFLFISGVIFSAFGVEVLHKLMSNMNTSVSIITIGLAWILGCVLQSVGEVLRLFKKHPPKFSSREDFYKYWAKFYAKASPREKIQAERLNVIKEACGNTAIAIVIVCIIAPGCHIYRGAFSRYPTVLFVPLGLFLAILLYLMQRDHLMKYGEFVRSTVAFPTEEDNAITHSSTTK